MKNTFVSLLTLLFLFAGQNVQAQCVGTPDVTPGAFTCGSQDSPILTALCGSCREPRLPNPDGQIEPPPEPTFAEAVWWNNTEMNGAPIHIGPILDPTGKIAAGNDPVDLTKNGVYTFYVQCACGEVCESELVPVTLTVEGCMDAAVPTLSQWGLILLAMLLLIFGVAMVRRQFRTAY